MKVYGPTSPPPEAEKGEFPMWGWVAILLILVGIAIWLFPQIPV